MTRRVLDVEIRSEFKKGFGDIAKSFSALEKQLKNISKLTDASNKLASKLDRSMGMVNAQRGLGKAATSQQKLNQSIAEGVRIAKTNESAHTKLGRSLASLATAQKAGSISQKQRLESEIALLNQYVKKTGDLSVLQSRNNKFRDGQGRFVNFTKDSLRTVSDSLARSVEAGIKAGATRGNAVVVAQMKATSSRIRGAVERIGSAGYQPSFDNRSRQAAFYEAAWGNQGRRSGAGLSTQDLINRNTGVRNVGNTGLMLGDDTRFNQQKLAYLAKQEAGYAKLQNKAVAVATRIRSLNFGPDPVKSQAGIQKMIDGYNRLGHVLFQLQYSTMTLFGFSGIGLIMRQADAYITLRNQVARTSDTIDDLGANMKDVYDISMRTFSDANTVGNMYSRINKYSETLGLSREQVGGVTEAISGAFAASPGNATEKAASMYQFMQGFQSNRMGGDELRSVLEMAPFVGDILAKGLAKIRGMPEGSVVDLRKQGELGTPINTRDMAAVFSDPAIQKEIKQILGQQARTFGDLFQVMKTRLMQMTDQLVNGTPVISGLINAISRFISDDDKFAKFTEALTTATLALLTYGAAVTARGAIGAAGSLASGIGARMGFGMSNMMTGVVPLDGSFGPQRSSRMSNAAANAMYGAAHRDNISRTFKSVGGGIASGAGAVAGGAANVLLGVGTALNSLKNPGTAAKNVLGGVTTTFTKASTGIAASSARLSAGYANVAAKGQIGSTIMAGLGRALMSLGPVVVSVIGFFTTLSLPLIAIAGIIALLVMRFNKLLGAMSGGMNIMDILTGTWNMLMDQLGKAASFLKNSFLGEIWSGITGFIDGILKFLGKAAKENPYFRQAQADRMYGGTDGQFGIQGGNGKVYRGTLQADGRYNYARDENGRLIEIAGGAADVRWGERATTTPNLPAGNKMNVPEATPSKDKNKGPKDPWPEFIRDLRLKIQDLLDLDGMAPQFRDIQQDVNANLKKAMDVMNFDSSTYSTLTEAWDAFAKANATKAAQVLQWTTQLKELKLAEAIRQFAETLQDELAASYLDTRKARVSSLGGSRLDNETRAIRAMMVSPLLNQDTAETVRRDTLSSLSTGNIRNARDGLLEGQSAEFVNQFESYLTTLNNDAEMVIVNTKRRANELATQALAQQAQSLGLFGNQRAVQEEINALVLDYNEQYGNAFERGAMINEELRKEIELIRQRNQLQQDYNSNWKNGFAEAIREYSEGLDNIATATKDVFTNALKGVEDGLVNMMTNADLKMSDIRQGISDLLKSIQTDVARMFVQQMVMKPITGWIEGMFGSMFDIQDQAINAQNVYINGAGLGAGGGWTGGFDPSTFFKGGSGEPGSATGGFMGGMMKKGLSMFSNFLPGPLGAIGKIFSMFHGGGTVGSSTMNGVFNPSVFAGARRYHTGGIAGLPALGVNEVPAILQRGEKVLTAAQYSAMNSGASSTTFAPSIAINYTAPAGSGGSGEASSEDQAKALSKMVQGAVNEALLEYDKNSRRPGNPAYLANKRR